MSPGRSAPPPVRRRRRLAGGDRRPPRALAREARRGARAVLLGLDGLDDSCWAVLRDAGVEVVRAASVADAIEAVSTAQVVLAGAGQGARLTAAVRARPEIAAVHVVVCAALDSPRELRAALDSGADDVMRVPFEPEVLAARVAAGLQAARLRANEALLRSLVTNIPGAVYRCACDSDWTMLWLSDEIEAISGYPAREFIDSSVRSFASVIHPDDREQVEQSVLDAVDAGRAYTLEYRIVRRDGGER